MEFSASVAVDLDKSTRITSVSQLLGEINQELVSISRINLVP